MSATIHIKPEDARRALPAAERRAEWRHSYRLALGERTIQVALVAVLSAAAAAVYLGGAAWGGFVGGFGGAVFGTFLARRARRLRLGASAGSVGRAPRA